MANEKSALVIADIGGYTRFMKVHRWNLAHAQLAVAGLLEAVIDQAGPLELVKLEGDAAFFWLKDSRKSTWDELANIFTAMRNAFVAKRDTLVAERTCSCDACQQVDQLRLKFVAHEGEVAEQRVKRFVELAGVDVILVHRMLKNDVPVPEYVLFTEAVHSALGDEVKARAQKLDHDFEGLGKTPTYFVDALSLAQHTEQSIMKRPPVQLPFWQFWLARLKLVWASLPYVLHLKSHSTKTFGGGVGP